MNAACSQLAAGHLVYRVAPLLPFPCSCTACGAASPARPRCSATTAASSRLQSPLPHSCLTSASSTAPWATRRLRALSSAPTGPSRTCCGRSCWSARRSTGPSRQVWCTQQFKHPPAVRLPACNWLCSACGTCGAAFRRTALVHGFRTGNMQLSSAECVACANLLTGCCSCTALPTRSTSSPARPTTTRCPDMRHCSVCARCAPFTRRPSWLPACCS